MKLCFRYTHPLTIIPMSKLETWASAGFFSRHMLQIQVPLNGLDSLHACFKNDPWHWCDFTKLSLSVGSLASKRNAASIFAKKNLAVVLDYAVYTGEKTLFIHVLTHTHTFILLQDQRISMLFYAASPLHKYIFGVWRHLDAKKQQQSLCWQRVNPTHVHAESLSILAIFSTIEKRNPLCTSQHRISCRIRQIRIIFLTLSITCACTSSVHICW